MGTVTTYGLEKETENFIHELAAKNVPPVYKLKPQEARRFLEEMQSVPLEMPPVELVEKKVPWQKGEVAITLIRPRGIQAALSPILLFHGAGWVMGSLDTHRRLAYELAYGAQAALVFVHFSLSPEARFPTAIEEAYAATKYIAEKGGELGLNTKRLCIVGDSVGGNMAIAVTLLAKERGGPKIDAQVLFYPVTTAELNSRSYEQFADGPWLTKAAMEWFWNAYEPDANARSNPLISPLKASLDQLKGLPQAVVITAENDVLRDEGEAYAHKLMQAGVRVTAVRFLGTMHDFVMLNAITKTPAARAAISFANGYLGYMLHT
jgi:acetyl esterase